MTSGAFQEALAHYENVILNFNNFKRSHDFIVIQDEAKCTESNYLCLLIFANLMPTLKTRLVAGSKLPLLLISELTFTSALTKL
jgi:hypothetical protein